MDRGLDDALKLLAALPVPRPGPVPLDDDYVACIARVENLPQNQRGADKTWVSQRIEADRLHFARARRL